MSPTVTDVETEEDVEQHVLIQKILGIRDLHRVLFESQKFDVSKQVPEKGEQEVEIRYMPNGMRDIGAVYGGTGDSVTLAMETLLQTLSTQKPGEIESICTHLCEIAGDNAHAGGGYLHELYTDDRTDAPEHDEPVEENLADDEYIPHNIEVVHDADEFDEDVDLETHLFQLEEKSTRDQTIATVNNYVHDTSGETIKVLVELPDQSHGRLTYDVPDSVDSPLMDLLDVAAVDGKLGEVSYSNIELLKGAHVPVYHSDRFGWMLTEEGFDEPPSDNELSAESESDGVAISSTIEDVTGYEVDTSILSVENGDALTVVLRLCVALLILYYLNLLPPM